MTAQEYSDLTAELNEALEDNKYLENQGLCFNYRTYGYADVICFGDQPLYCSEDGGNWDYEKDKEIPIKKVVIKAFKEYVKALRNVKL